MQAFEGKVRAPTKPQLLTLEQLDVGAPTMPTCACCLHTPLGQPGGQLLSWGGCRECWGWQWLSSRPSWCDQHSIAPAPPSKHMATLDNTTHPSNSQLNQHVTTSESTPDDKRYLHVELKNSPQKVIT